MKRACFNNTTGTPITGLLKINRFVRNRSRHRRINFCLLEQTRNRRQCQCAVANNAGQIADGIFQPDQFGGLHRVGLYRGNGILAAGHQVFGLNDTQRKIKSGVDDFLTLITLSLSVAVEKAATPSLPTCATEVSVWLS